MADEKISGPAGAPQKVVDRDSPERERVRETWKQKDGPPGDRTFRKRKAGEPKARPPGE